MLVNLIPLATTEYFTMYLGTFILIFTALVVIWAAVAISNFKRFAQERDLAYAKRLEGIESVIKRDLKSILEILKKP